MGDHHGDQKTKREIKSEKVTNVLYYFQRYQEPVTRSLHLPIILLLL